MARVYKHLPQLYLRGVVCLIKTVNITLQENHSFNRKQVKFDHKTNIWSWAGCVRAQRHDDEVKNGNSSHDIPSHPQCPCRNCWGVTPAACNKQSSSAASRCPSPRLDQTHCHWGPVLLTEHRPAPGSLRGKSTETQNNEKQPCNIPGDSLVQWTAGTIPGRGGSQSADDQ